MNRSALYSLQGGSVRIRDGMKTNGNELDGYYNCSLAWQEWEKSFQSNLDSSSQKNILKHVAHLKTRKSYKVKKQQQPLEFKKQTYIFNALTWPLIAPHRKTQKMRNQPSDGLTAQVTSDFDETLNISSTTEDKRGVKQKKKTNRTWETLEEFFRWGYCYSSF